jgi:hypothetical protein
MHPRTEPDTARKQARSKPTWASVKAKLARLDKLALIGLIQALYAADKDNQLFLHTRFGLSEDVLKPYKQTLDRWLWPDVLRNQVPSVANAKKAISGYRMAVGDPAGLAELTVFYCEKAIGFCESVGYQDVGFYNALVRMFEQAIQAAHQLPPDDCEAIMARLESVRSDSECLGYGVGDDLEVLLEKYDKE